MEFMNKVKVDELKKKFEKNSPFPHLVIDNFLNVEKVAKLALALKKEEFEEKDSDLFSFKQTQDLHYSENKEIKEFVGFLESQEFSDLVGGMTGIKVESGALDLFGSLYENTSYLLCHDDQLEDRKIAYIIYLGDNFNEDDGGALFLREDNKGKPGEIAQKYYPKFNSLVMFEVSKKSWHEVEEVIGKKKRYAIGGWLH
ncbi:MAG: 2OG-Fe(II) oxygenase family protein [Nanoarchaeota archaeon]|nr:2OG-Fe(II) oxygenase family protein [Nanoarchaeota archaeon]